MGKFTVVTIRSAIDADAPAFRSIENSAGTLFEEVPDLAWIAASDDTSVERYRELVAQGFSWCALDDSGACVGFICATREGDELHIWELAVRRDRQRCGIGRALLDVASDAALAHALRAVTLTTFRHVLWNAPFYRGHGFQTLEPADLGDRLRSVLEDERLRGLPAQLRCAMRLRLSTRLLKPGVPGNSILILIRKSRPADAERVIEIWRGAVDATHDFLSPTDRIAIEHTVRAILPTVSLWLATNEQDRPLAFMLLERGHLEALFIDPKHRGRGIGRALVLHALSFHPAMTTDVNAQNVQAVGFYAHMGFKETGRSPFDSEGRPYPLIHLAFSERDGGHF